MSSQTTGRSIMRRLTITIACLFLAGAALCGEKKTIQGTSFQGNDYEILFPRDWEVTHGIMGTDVLALSPLESEDDEFRENINVALENIPASLGSKGFLAQAARDLKNYYGLPADTAYVKVNLGNCIAYHLHYHATLGVKKREHDQYYVLKGVSAYCITCTYAVGKRAQYKPIMDRILMTFLVK